MESSPATVPLLDGILVVMGIEIERRFVLSEPPSATVLAVDPTGGVHIRQGYLAGEDKVEVRLRITPFEHTLTVKAGAGLARTEVNLALSPADAEELWPHTLGRRIDKVRRHIALGPFTAELDEYFDALTGLFTVEVEFDSRAAAERFAPPAWFGREVTDRGEWTNASLARQGLPPTDD